MVASTSMESRGQPRMELVLLISLLSLDLSLSAPSPLPPGFIFMLVFGSRVLDRPHWHDILPLKLSIWIYLSMKNLPQTIQVGECPSQVLPESWALACGLRAGLGVFQEVKQYYEEYQLMKQQQREEAEAVQEATSSKRLTARFP